MEAINISSASIRIKVWASEEDRDTGESFIEVPSSSDVSDIVAEATDFYFRGNAAVEVVGGENLEHLLYHVSNDLEKPGMAREDYRSDFVIYRDWK